MYWYTIGKVDSWGDVVGLLLAVLLMPLVERFADYVVYRKWKKK